jgi:putative methyltransferase
MDINVLISQPNMYTKKVFFPLVFLRLKTYIDTQKDIQNINWLDPIFRNLPPETLLKDIDLASINILGLSCYDWNFGLNLEIARAVKEQNPDCLVVAGGPHPDWSDQHFFEKNPLIDIVVYQAGEVPFAEIIRAYQNNKSTEGIPNTITRERKYPPGKKINVLENSPWLNNKEWVLDFKKKHIDSSDFKECTVLWETDRGCPYKCSFCDWGSETNNKITKVEVDLAKREIDFFCDELKPTIIHHCGANFGILKQDLEITNYLCEKKKDYPKAFQYSTSKNHSERALEIAKSLYKAKLLKKHIISLQHTDQYVLDCIDRDNIPVRRQLPVIKELNKSKMPCISQMILGLPGDNLERWINALTDTLEWGIHYECSIHDFQLLPNAPAADKNYIEKWGIETISRYHYINTHHKNKEQDSNKQPFRSSFVVSTKTFSKDEWVQMKLFGKSFMALHNSSITKWSSMYCRNTLDISYRNYYAGLFDNFLGSPEYPYTNSLFCKVRDHITKFAYEENSTDEMKIEGLNNGRHYQLEEYLMWNYLYDDEVKSNRIFWDELIEYHKKSYPNQSELYDLLRYSQEMIFTIDYDPEEGKVISCHYDWPSYIEQCTWIGRNNYEPEENHELISKPEQFTPPKRWVTHDQKLGQFPIGPHQDVNWEESENPIESFSDSILMAKFFRGTRTVFNRGQFEGAEYE